MVQKISKNTPVDLLVVGSGLSGMAAALFAAKQGISVAQVSQSSTLLYHSGLIDVLGSIPGTEPKAISNPVKGIEELLEQYPDHLYSKIDLEELEESLEVVRAFLGEQGVNYLGNLHQNRRILTSVGTVKRSCLLPATMVKGADAIEQRAVGVIVGIKRLRGFSSRQITEMMKPEWPELSSVEIEYPGSVEGKEVVPEHLARALDNTDNVFPLIEILKPLVKDATVLGIPPILGIQKSQKIHQLMEEKLGVSIFEIPMMPPSIPGIRMLEAFESGLRSHGVRQIRNYHLKELQKEEDGCFTVKIETPQGTENLRARGLILASGRFLGKGLQMTDDRVEETLLNLPVVQPEFREDFYHQDFFDPAGHALNRAGIATDRSCRPLKLNDSPLAENLFAIGSIQAGQDWTREKSGSAIAIASAFKAVLAFDEYLSGRKDDAADKQMKLF